MLSTLIGSTVICVPEWNDNFEAFCVTTPTLSTNSNASKLLIVATSPVAIITLASPSLGVSVIPLIILPRCGVTAVIVLFT